MKDETVGEGKDKQKVEKQRSKNQLKKVKNIIKNVISFKMKYLRLFVSPPERDGMGVGGDWEGNCQWCSRGTKVP